LIGSFLSFLAFILAPLTLPISHETGRDILAYVVLATLLTTALLYWLLNLLDVSISSDIARDVYLDMLVLGLLIIEPAYLMDFRDYFFYSAHLPLLLYSYVLISVGGAFTVLILQSEPRKVDIQPNI
jgi:predicted membrane channel-forming protein YqfA (hemolysin III family)